MLKNFTRSAVAFSLLAVTGCAGSYHTIQPDRIATYQAVAAPNAPVEFAYQYSALLTNGSNKKYAKKERKKGYQVVAVRVKNNTASDLLFARDLDLSFGDRPIMPVPAMQVATDLKQGVAIYALYVLLNVNIGGSTDPYTGQTTGGTFLPTGPFIAAGNMIGAGAANKNMREEFIRYDMANRVIRPGETVYGIVSLREFNVAPLKLTLRNPAAMVAPAATPVPVTAPQATPVAPPAASPAPVGPGH